MPIVKLIDKSLCDTCQHMVTHGGYPNCNESNFGCNGKELKYCVKVSCIASGPYFPYVLKEGEFYSYGYMKKVV